MRKGFESRALKFLGGRKLEAHNGTPQPCPGFSWALMVAFIHVQREVMTRRYFLAYCTFAQGECSKVPMFPPPTWW